MGVFNGLFPVLPGKEDAFRSFVADVTGVDMSVPDDSPQPETVLDWAV